MKKIISVSRRTDIPAFYGEWFRHRVQAGFAGYVNPFGGKRHRVSLTRSDVAAFVFWSKNYVPFLDSLAWLDDLGYPFYLQFTITGMPPFFEPGLPDIATRIDTLARLGLRYGPRRVLWRYDPMVAGDVTDADYHLRRFREMAAALEGFTERCYISFACWYDKVRKNFARFTGAYGITVHDPEAEAKVDLAQNLAEIAGRHGMALYACCDDELVGPTVRKAACIDGDLVQELFYPEGLKFRGKGTRKSCGCAESKDIGAYDTCPHGCVYCYANVNPQTAARRQRRHDPESAFLGYDRRRSAQWLVEMEREATTKRPALSRNTSTKQRSLF